MDDIEDVTDAVTHDLNDHDRVYRVGEFVVKVKTFLVDADKPGQSRLRMSAALADQAGRALRLSDGRAAVCTGRHDHVLGSAPLRADDAGAPADPSEALAAHHQRQLDSLETARREVARAAARSVALARDALRLPGVGLPPTPALLGA